MIFIGVREDISASLSHPSGERSGDANGTRLRLLTQRGIAESVAASTLVAGWTLPGGFTLNAFAQASFVEQAIEHDSESQRPHGLMHPDEPRLLSLSMNWPRRLLFLSLFALVGKFDDGEPHWQQRPPP